MEASNVEEPVVQMDLEKKVAFILEVQSKYEGILLSQAESIARLLTVVEKLAGHTERILDIIEVASNRLDLGEDRIGRLEKTLERLVGSSDRYSGEIRALIDTQRTADERVQSLVSAMGKFINQHASA